jgi:tetratricopeptide (TPR) repeat protein
MDVFWQYWNSLTPGVREGIIAGIVGGVAVAGITSVCKLLGFSLLAGGRRLSVAAARRILSKEASSVPPPPAPQPPLVIKVEAPQLIPQQPPTQHPIPQPELPSHDDSALSTAVPFIPRPPVIGFVARRDADGRDIVECLREKLAPQQPSQLVTLSGPGGVGKTTLAAETARELIKVFGGRVVWSSAEGRADFTLSTLLDDTAAQLGREDLRTLAPDAKEAAVHALVADPPALVMLDNYETIKPDAKPPIEEWFAHAQCSALFTSRQRVGATFNVTIAAMSREEAEEFLQRVIKQTQDAQIFSVEVRRHVYETAEANPFVMQWVVGQIDAAQEPQTVLAELQQGGGDAAQRVFDRSFNLPQLGDDGRAALLALSLFAPSATRNALAEVAGFGADSHRTGEAVKNLRALWLIKAIDENRRFTVEGLTRSLAKTRLSKDPRAAEFRQRFVAYFLSYAEAHAQPTPEDFNALEAEKDNVLSAMDTAFELSNWASVMLLMNAINFDGANGFLIVRGYWDEAVKRGEQAVAAARKANDEWSVAQFTGNIGIVRWHHGEYDEARQAFQQALNTFKKLKGDKNVASFLHLLGALAQTQGEIEEARRLYNESLEIVKRLSDQNGIACTLHQLGTLAQDQGEIEEARRLYNESLEISKKLSNQSNIAATTSQLGIVHYILAELNESKAKHEESLAIRRKLGAQQGIAIDLHQLGNIASSQEEFDEARRLYNETLEINKKLDDQSITVSALHNLAAIAYKQGEIEEAVRLLRETLSILEKLKLPDAEIVRRDLERLEGEAPEGES